MPNFRKFLGVVKAGQMGYLIGPFPPGGPKKSEWYLVYIGIEEAIKRLSD